MEGHRRVSWLPKALWLETFRPNGLPSTTQIARPTPRGGSGFASVCQFMGG